MRIAVLLAQFVVLLACVPVVTRSGAAVYRDNCVVCHGSSGAGDGPMAAELPVPPSDLRALSAANGGAFPADRVMATIYGYRGRDYSGLMPAFGAALEGRQTIWTTADGQEIATPAALVALVAYLERLQDSPSRQNRGKST